MMKFEVNGIDGAIGDLRATVAVEIAKAAMLVYATIVEPRGDGAGSPVASDRYVASVAVALNRATGSDPGETGYNYPSADEHRYSVANLPPAVVGADHEAAQAALSGFALGDAIYFGTDAPYAARIEYEGHSWQVGSAGVFQPSVAAAVAKYGR